MSHEPYDVARNIALAFLRQQNSPEQHHIQEAVDKARLIFPNVDDVKLFRDLEVIFNVWVPEGSVMDDPTGHEIWLSDKRAKIQWDFWRRYELYLEQDKKISPQVISRLDSLTDLILGHLEDPMRPGPWDRRGMVVGQVQSGKTANYTGLICKAADVGYKLIVVLAGIHNSLRSQTQLRLDEGFLGRDSNQNRLFRLDSPRMGVGMIILDSGRIPAAHSLTTSNETGDFKKGVSNGIAPHIGSDPAILVVKKNGSILKNLLDWVRSNIAEKKGNVKIVPSNISLLLIDDEADNASINTKKLEENDEGGFKGTQDVTKINRLIRQFLKTFEKSSYVGYTATPFANIFIPPDADTDSEGEDLFPRSFIINLPPPSNYVGPVQVFGLDSQDSEIQTGLPIVRRVTDSEDQLPGKHKQTLTPTSLPISLREAMLAFILACAARRAREQVAVHNSMLVHVTRFVAVQRIVKDLIAVELYTLKRRLEYGDGGRTPTLRDELEEMWIKDYTPTTDAVKSGSTEYKDITSLSWEEVEPHLTQAALKIDIKEINGTATDVLDYYDNPNGISLIAVGGDKLSRGLTLEGLSVSYYLRASRMYDTLMQMGRWFGYREGYTDLCRLYTTPELAKWYKHITYASEELRSDFEMMAAYGHTPRDYGLKVQTHPGELAITSAGKIRYGTRIRVSYVGQLVETYRLTKKADIIDRNFNNTIALIQQLGRPQKQDRTAHYVWNKVASTEVTAYLKSVSGNIDPPKTPASYPGKLAEFIEKKNIKAELISWTVALINISGAEHRRVIEGLDVGLTRRTPDIDSTDATYVIRNRHIITPAHEWIDLTDPEYAQAVVKRGELDKISGKPSKISKDEPNGQSVRAVRPKERGLLLLYALDPDVQTSEGDQIISVFPPDDERRHGNPIMGFAISFPGSNRPDDLTDAIEYMTNQIYVKEYRSEELEGLISDEELNSSAK